MAQDHRGPGLGMAAVMAAFLVLGTYFTYAAIRGEHGVFARAAVEAEIAALTAERDLARAELDTVRIRVAGLSDTSVDLDLLDERARAVLGWMRRDELVLR